MVKQTVAGLVAAIATLGMTSSVYAQAPTPKAEEQKADTTEKKPAAKKAAPKTEAKKSADKPAAAADKTVDTQNPKPAEVKK